MELQHSAAAAVTASRSSPHDSSLESCALQPTARKAMPPYDAIIVTRLLQPTLQVLQLRIELAPLLLSGLTQLKTRAVRKPAECCRLPPACDNSSRKDSMAGLVSGDVWRLDFAIVRDSTREEAPLILCHPRLPAREPSQCARPGLQPQNSRQGVFTYVYMVHPLHSLSLPLGWLLC